jgi:hypothetical protein
MIVLKVQVVFTNCTTAGIDHGHAALLIDGKAYTYGRYGNTDGLTTGDGVLRVYNDAEKYLYLTRKQGDDVSVYDLNLSNSEAKKIIECYEHNRVPYYNDKDKNPNHQSFTYSANDERKSYELYGDNCATVIVDALNQARPGVMNTLTDDPNTPSSPWGLKSALQNDYNNNKGEGVVNRVWFGEKIAQCQGDEAVAAVSSKNDNTVKTINQQTNDKDSLQAMLSGNSRMNIADNGTGIGIAKQDSDQRQVQNIKDILDNFAKNELRSGRIANQEVSRGKSIC